ncbi:MAG: hypothetical protein AAGD47_00930 [Pseudomonadota bacterium]
MRLSGRTGVVTGVTGMLDAAIVSALHNTVAGLTRTDRSGSGIGDDQMDRCCYEGLPCRASGRMDRPDAEVIDAAPERTLINGRAVSIDGGRAAKQGLS